MDLALVWELFLAAVWMQVGCIAEIHDRHGAVTHLSMKDNKTYDFFYKTDKERRCDVGVQRTEDGSFLHICIFPPEDVYLFVPTHLRVLEAGTNTTLYTRHVSVEDQVLLDPPTHVTLHHTGLPGQLQGERKQVETLMSLVPGELLKLQIRINRMKYDLDHTSGHWSHWSQPVAEMVPQSADDISLECYTSDLQNVTCQWDQNIYEDVSYQLFYRLDTTQVVRVKLGLSDSQAPLDRTFYSHPFILNGSVKTAPPGHLQGRVDGGRLCLSWVTPHPALSAHLLYQVHYRNREGGPWLTLSGDMDMETWKCLEGLAGCRYSVQVRARPNGSPYSGEWSDWSLTLSGSIPQDIGALLLLFIPLLMLVLAIVFISLIPRYLSKLQQLLWPPIPNLEKVLQGFLSEINGQIWDPPFTAKQNSEENPASIVEIIYTEDTAAGTENAPRESAPLLIPEGCFSTGEQADRNPDAALEVSQDYVTLSIIDAIPSGQKGNEYVYEHTAECRGGARQAATTPHCSSTATCTSGMDIVNRSYLLTAESSRDRGLEPGPAGPSGGKLYTNMDAPPSDHTP
ncbi:hypothetical protein NHX12_032943 [Muraenolepis orangiensis]|uniref:Fibronectin type-III domain-containing protein n=1 Tax=Muraenolepis orangiensis TaxID=630683 RepID=A0A9Q0E1R1_9TELE|nr:hypothetical protein NHX12_032943 [Muraenolepis orangiensis]